MFYKEYEPIDPLKKYIKCFWRLEHDYSQEPFTEGERIWPDGHFELIFSYGENYLQKIGTGWKVLPRNFLIGQFSTELLLQSNGITGLYGVRFHAWGLYPFLQTPMGPYSNKITDSLTIADGRFKSIAKTVIKANEDRGIESLQDYFIQSVSKSNIQSYVEPIARDIYDRNGIVQINELAETYKIYPRKLQRLFETEVGISAKLFAKIVRFNRAWKMIMKDPYINLAEVAYTCGYADQPHFIRNFKSLYGITPRQFKERVLRLRAYLENKD